VVFQDVQRRHRQVIHCQKIGSPCAEDFHDTSRLVPFRRQMQWRPSHAPTRMNIGAVIEQPSNDRGYTRVGEGVKSRAVLVRRVDVESLLKKQLGERKALLCAPAAVPQRVRESKPGYCTRRCRSAK
jgi:hypothetical protein